MAARNLFSLLVGINDYPIAAHRLTGCRNDALAFKSYLDNRIDSAEFALRTKILFDREATRSNIAREFETHLGKAGPDDVAVFYYSGHGAREKAGEFFAHLEPDGMNETLVCWDSRLEDGMDLADKELSTLVQLAGLNGAHVVMILDCCHSGSGTRSLERDVTHQGYAVRRIEDAANDRSLDSYLLPQQGRGVLGSEELIMPTNRHVALMAAQSFEEAKETHLGGRTRGVFSYSLMEILQNSAADLTYEDLIERSRVLVSRRTFEQRPTLYAPQPEDAKRTFLLGGANGTKPYFTLMHEREHGWVLEGGAVNGLLLGDPVSDPTTLAIFSDDAKVDDLSQATGRVRITDLRPDKAKVLPLGDTELFRGETYKARIISLPVNEIKVYLHGDGHAVGLLRSAMIRNPLATSYLQETRSLEQADYKIVAVRDQYSISRAADGMGDVELIRRDGIDYRPIVEQERGFHAASARKVIENLVHIAKWEQTLAVGNPRTRLTASSIQVELLQPFEDTPIAASGKGYHFSYTHSGGLSALPGFRLKLTNRSSQKLYVSLAYLSSQFEINPFLISQGGTWLDPGASVFALDGEVIEAIVPDALASLGIKQTTEIFKIFMSTTAFQLGSVELPGLGLPKPVSRTLSAPTHQLDQLIQEHGTRSAFQASGTGRIDDWNAFSASIVVERK
ncbi:MAG: caspase family protein [Bacteroidota bacterium]